MIREVPWTKAVEELQQGKLVALPTETVYGLGASIAHESALQQIFKVKGRPSFDPLIVHVASIEQAKTLVSEWPSLAEKLAQAFWPGALTLILPKAKTVSTTITAGKDSVGIRLPSHPIMKSIIEKLGTPIAAPSANRFKKTSPTTTDHVKNEFPTEDFAIVEGGPSEVGIESTIVRIVDDELQILRLGMISQAEIQKATGVSVSLLTSEAALGLAPGTLKEHYKTNKPLYMVDTSEVPNSLAHKNYFEIILSTDPFQAARELYAKMRIADQTNAEILIIRKLAHLNGPHWEAIWDRIARASQPLADLG